MEIYLVSLLPLSLLKSPIRALAAMECILNKPDQTQKDRFQVYESCILDVTSKGSNALLQLE